MRAFFVQIKCELGKSYDVATAIADAEIASRALGIVLALLGRHVELLHALGDLAYADALLP